MEKPKVIVKLSKKTKPKLKLVDLFAGTGAFSYAFKQTNKVDIVFANDFEPTSKKIYDLNNTHELTLGDINDILPESIPSFDILTAGFPCQPFSIAGKQKGFEDPRSNVFFKIIEILKNHNPKCIVLENVKNLLTHDNSNTFKTIKEKLEEIGYYITYKVLDTSEITGIPQHRERIYIVGFNEKSLLEKFNLDFPKIPINPIGNYLEENINEKYYYNDRFSVWNTVSQGVIKPNTFYQYRRTLVRENKSGVCPTLTANMGGGGHNVPLLLDDNGIRKLTPRECFNLQGFPNDYVLPEINDSSLYKLAGNAVSVPIISLIANRLMEIIY
jgi:DNA (cytosine-5)-methyltransferase 1